MTVDRKNAAGQWLGQTDSRVLRRLGEIVNSLKCRGSYSATSNNVTLVDWPAIDGWAVTFGRARRGPGPPPTQDPPRCTKYKRSPYINGQCINHRIALRLERKTLRTIAEKSAVVRDSREYETKNRKVSVQFVTFVVQKLVTSATLVNELTCKYS